MYLQINNEPNFLGQGFQNFRVLPTYKQTDRQAYSHDWKHYQATFAGGKYGPYTQKPIGMKKSRKKVR